MPAKMEAGVYGGRETDLRWAEIELRSGIVPGIFGGYRRRSKNRVTDGGASRWRPRSGSLARLWLDQKVGYVVVGGSGYKLQSSVTM